MTIAFQNTKLTALSFQETEPQVPQVYDFMDYRLFLKSFFDFRRKLSAGDLRPYNYQMFSAAANIRSPNYLKMIIEGKRNLSEDMISKFSKAMGLVKDQADDFRLLVEYGQASDPAERNLLLKKLSEHRVRTKIKSGEIDKKIWNKIPNWTGWVLYAMTDQEGVRFDSTSLKKLLRNKASENEIDQAIEGLIQAGYLIRNSETGEIKKSTQTVDSGEEIPVALVRKLQTQLMYLGLESLYQDAPTDREFGTLTLALTKSEFEEIKFKLRQLRKNLHKDNAIHRTKEKGERVYQLNIQLFPVTETSENLPPIPRTAEINLEEQLLDSDTLNRTHDDSTQDKI